MATTLKSQADLIEEQLIAFQENIHGLSRVLADIIRQLRPDLALLYADHEAAMVADLIQEYGEEGLIEELMGLASGALISTTKS